MSSISLNPNEPNPNFMMYQELARKIFMAAHIGNDECFWLMGKTGIGKTTFILWLEEFSSLYKVKTILFHAGEGLKLEEVKETVERAIKPSFFSKFFLKRKVGGKPFLLIMDEIVYIKDEEIFRYLVSKLDDPDLRMTIVFSSVKPVEIVKKSFKGRDIEEISLKMPPKEVVMEMIRKRIESTGENKFQPFGKEAVEELISHSTTPREVLIKLEKMAEKLENSSLETMRTKCPQCGTTFSYQKNPSGPTKVKCPDCGKEGMMR